MRRLASHRIAAPNMQQPAMASGGGSSASSQASAAAAVCGVIAWPWPLSTMAAMWKVASLDAMTTLVGRDSASSLILCPNGRHALSREAAHL